MSRLLDRADRHLRGDRRRRGTGDRRRGANFFATVVRYISCALGAQRRDAPGSREASLEATPVPSLGLLPRVPALPISATLRAVDVPMVAARADVHDSPADVANALNLPKIEHPAPSDRQEFGQLATGV
jgi:hypothetical protein